MHKLVFSHSLKIIPLLILPLLLLIFFKQNYLIPYILPISLFIYIIINITDKSYLEFIIISLLIIYIYLSIIIIPYSFYATWFKFLEKKIPDGEVTKTLLTIFSLIWSYLYTKLSKKIEIKRVLMLLIFIALVSSIFIRNKFIFLTIFLMLFILTFTKKYFIKKTIFVLIVFFISLLIYSKTIVNGSAFVDSSSYNIRNVIIKIFPNTNLLSSIPGLNDNFSTKTGKPPLLTSNSLLKIKGIPGERVYLRMKIGEYNEKSLVEKKIIKEKINYLNSLKITILTDFMPILPTTIDSKGSDLYSIKDLNLTMNLFEPLLKGDSYYLQRGGIFIDKNKYLIDKPLVDKKIIELAQLLKRDSSIETVKNIQNYLLTNYEYSLDVEESKDYIEEFLFNTHKGFCIHFTRAFIILARLNNITVREVSGYMIDIPDIEPYMNNQNVGEVIITGKNSHLWPEVLINNEWKIYEVTATLYREMNTISKNNIKLPKVNSSGFIEKNRDIIINKSLPYIVIIIVMVISTVTIILTRPNLKRLIKKAEKKGIPHPELTGWIEWFNNINLNSIYQKKLLKIFYFNLKLEKKDILFLKRKIYSLDKSSTILDKSSLE